MSLIVQALKRAQEGASRRLPPLSGHQSPGPYPGRTSPLDGGRRLRTPIVIGVAVAVVGAGLWAARGSMMRAPVAMPAPPLFVVEPLVRAAPAAAKSASEAGTSIEEVRAALLAAQPLETVVPIEKDAAVAVERNVAEPSAASRGPAPTAGRSTKPAENRGWAPRPPVTTLVDRVPIQTGATTSPIDVPVSRPVPAAERPISRPPAPSAAPALREAAVREASAVVKVHAEPAKESAEALAAGLRDQQGGQTAKAIDEYQRGLRADARNPGLHNNLGVALRDSGRLDEAIEAFQAALNIDPKYEKALNNLGVSRYQQGNYAEAVDLFSQALRINPANVESSINLGMIYFLAQRWDEALSAFQQALKYNPRSAEAHYNLGLLWERHGDAERALQAYRKFIELAGVAHAPLAARVSEHIRLMERSGK